MRKLVIHSKDGVARLEVMKKEKFEELYRTYQNLVYRVSLHYTKDTYAAEDVTQKVFYQFYTHFDNVNPDCVKAYLARSARNLALNYLRDRKREVHGDYLDVIGEEEAPLRSAEEIYISGENRRKKKEFVDSILERLREENESWYQIVNLIFCLEKPHDEVAKELGITRDVLYSKLYRAKKWMHKKFEQEFKDL